MIKSKSKFNVNNYTMGSAANNSSVEDTIEDQTPNSAFRDQDLSAVRMVERDSEVTIEDIKYQGGKKKKKIDRVVSLYVKRKNN